ncbi:MAG: cysteine peptidase family C39 domain-containing protein [Acidobacteriota bacterium]
MSQTRVRSVAHGISGWGIRTHWARSEAWQPLRRRVLAWWLGARFLGTRGVVFQKQGNDCGLAALQMVLEHFCVGAAAGDVKRLVRLKPQGTTLRTLGGAAEALGLRAYGWILQDRDLRRASLPVLAWLKWGHYVVIVQLLESGSLVVLDPAVGRLLYNPRPFWRHWAGEALLFCRPGAAKPLPLARPA